MRSHHFGVVGRHVERLAEAGLVALAFGNTPKAIGAWGSKRPIFGTNPIALRGAAGGQGAPSWTWRLSQVARGKILSAAPKASPPGRLGHRRSAGAPTDATAALKGTLQGIGGAKGAALALMVEGCPWR